MAATREYNLLFRLSGCIWTGTRTGLPSFCLMLQCLLSLEEVPEGKERALSGGAFVHCKCRSPARVVNQVLVMSYQVVLKACHECSVAMLCLYICMRVIWGVVKTFSTGNKNIVIKNFRNNWDLLLVRKYDVILNGRTYSSDYEVEVFVPTFLQD